MAIFNSFLYVYQRVRFLGPLRSQVVDTLPDEFGRITARRPVAPERRIEALFHGGFFFEARVVPKDDAAGGFDKDIGQFENPLYASIYGVGQKTWF